MKLALTLVLALIVGLVSIAGADGGKNGNRTELLARLSGSATGKAKFKVRTDRQPEAELEVEAQRLVAGAVYDIVVGPVTFEATANSFRSIHVEKKFRGASNIPAIAKGTIVAIMDEAGNIVAKGTLN